jgi:hypothetical protein
MCVGQSISGNVINEATQEPLSYASIGVINTNFGTITNEKGFFKLDARSFSPEAKIRISMIGFEAQVLQVKDLIEKETTIRLKEQIVQLSEVIVKPKKVKSKTIGTKSTSKKSVTGWGGCGNCGEDIGGVERGIRIELSKPVFVEKVNFHVAYFGFDSMLVRLHIRKIDKGYPRNELLTTNIYARIKSTGWHEIDLREYNLSFSEDIAVSIEWVKAWGKTKDKENSLKLSLALFKGTLFAKDGNEGNWDVQKNVSPGIYLTVEEL